MILIEKEVIDTLEHWNRQSGCQNEQYDELLVQALLLCSVSAEDLEAGNVGKDVKEFIESMFLMSVLLKM